MPYKLRVYCALLYTVHDSIIASKKRKHTCKIYALTKYHMTEKFGRNEVNPKSHNDVTILADCYKYELALLTHAGVLVSGYTCHYYVLPPISFTELVWILRRRS